MSLLDYISLQIARKVATEKKYPVGDISKIYRPELGREVDPDPFASEARYAERFPPAPLRLLLAPTVESKRDRQLRQRLPVLEEKRAYLQKEAARKREGEKRTISDAEVAALLAGIGYPPDYIEAVLSGMHGESTHPIAAMLEQMSLYATPAVSAALAAEAGLRGQSLEEETYNQRVQKALTQALMADTQLQAAIQAMSQSALRTVSPK